MLQDINIMLRGKNTRFHVQVSSRNTGIHKLPETLPSTFNTLHSEPLRMRFSKQNFLNLFDQSLIFRDYLEKLVFL